MSLRSALLKKRNFSVPNNAYGKLIKTALDALGIGTSSLLKGATLGKVDMSDTKATGFEKMMFGAKEGRPVQGFEPPSTLAGKIYGGVVESIPAMVWGAPILKGLPAVRGPMDQLSKVGTNLVARNLPTAGVRGMLSRTLGKGIANVGQGIPYSGAIYAKNLLQSGQAPTLGEAGADLGIDLLTGGIPLIGIGAGTTLKTVRNAGKEGIEKSIKESVGEALESQIKTIDNKIKASSSMKEKASLLKQKNALLDQADPSRVTKGEADIKYVENVKKANEARAEIQKELTPVTEKLKKLKKDIIQQKTVAKGQTKDSVQVKLVKQTKQEIDNLEQVQKTLVDQRNAIKTENVPDISTPTIPTAKTEPTVVAPTKTDISDAENIRKEAYEFADSLSDQQRFIDEYESGLSKGTKEASIWGKITNNLREYAMKVTGKEMGEITDYYPHVFAGNESQTTQLVGDSVEEMITKNAYNPFASRSKNKQGYTKDIKYAVDEYLKAIDYETNKIAVESARKGIKPESENIIEDMAKEIGQQVKDKGASNVDIVKKARDVAVLEGKEMDTIRLNPINRFKSEVIDIYKGFRDIGLAPYIEKYTNYEAYAGHTYESLREAIGRNDFNTVINTLKTIFPSVDAFRVGAYLEKVAKYGGNVDETAQKLILRLHKMDGEQQLMDVLPKLDFPDGTTKDYVNTMLNYILSRSAKTKTVTAKLNGLFRKFTTAGFLGVNVSSSLLNLFEPRRLLGTANIKSMVSGLKDSLEQTVIKKTVDILDRYGYSRMNVAKESFINDKTARDAIQGLSGKMDDVVNASMFFFNKTENFKNRWFLNAYERDGKSLGLAGEDLIKYVNDKFRKYAVQGDVWGTVGAMRNEWVKTLFQFSQYATRDVGIMMSKARGLVKDKDKESVQYLLAWGLTSAIIYDIYEGIGLNPVGGVLALPVGLEYLDKDKSWNDVMRSVSPNIQLGVDISNVIYDYFDGTLDPEQGNVDDYLEVRLKKDMLRRVPGGNQLLVKTGGYIADSSKGYNESTTGKVRFPVGQAGVGDMLKGTVFGSNATDAGQEYWNNYSPDKTNNLTQLQTDAFKAMQQTQGQPAAAEMWQSTFDKNITPKTTVQDLLKGSEISKEAQKVADETGRTDIPATVDQILAKDAIDDQEFSAMKSMENELAKQAKGNPAIMERIPELLQTYAQNEGFGLTYDDYRTRQLGSGDLTTKQKAQVIQTYIEQGQIDIASWYKNDVLTAAVAKELYRMGVVADPDALWENAQMTDPYYKMKALQKLRETTVKGIISANKTYSNKRKTALKKMASRKAPKITVKSRSVKTRLTKIKSQSPKTYNVKSLNSILSRIKEVGQSNPTYKL